MSDGDAFFTFGIIVSLSTACVAGFGIEDSSYPWEHEAAVKSCINNGGYERLDWDFELFQEGDLQRYTVICKDKAVFYYDSTTFLKLLEEDKK